MIKDWDSMDWVSVLTLFISAIALAVSIKSCIDANNAVKISQTQFLQENRPYLLIEPISFKEIGSYFKIEIEGNELVRFNIRYRVTNIGNVVAKDIKYPKSAAFEGHGMIGASESTPPISLVPTQKISLDVWVLMKGESGASAKEYVDSYYSGNGHITNEFQVTYSSELKPSLMYRNTVKHDIYNNHADILKSDMEAYDCNKSM